MEYTLPNPCHACGRRHPSHSRTALNDYPRREYWCPIISEWFYRAWSHEKGE